MTPLEITLLILLATILAFVSGKIPFAVISSGIILALILTGVMTPAEAFGGFINTNVVMFVAMFVIGAGLTKTVLIDKAQSLVVRYKDNQRVLIFLSCAAAAFLGAITSATATAAIMIPLLVGIANDIGTSRSKLLYPAMACANIATQMTFMGQGASNMAWNDVMMKAGAPNPLHVWDFTVARIPMLATAILYMTFVGYKLMPDIPNGKFSDGASGQTGSEKITLAVQDHGPGIPDAEKARVFDRFYSADPSRTDKHNFGLGLSVAKELARLHHADLTVTDTPGGGAKFAVTFAARIS